ncbi:MAG: hypothetical protein KME21_17905 [Desmonostoc vinosum HA7617-LM4]|jgi:glycosyltransferase involved in cell wall biosynthesis|nr:hypothetical protein [Desmonostoc vinosum HA7617-LM4]
MNKTYCIFFYEGYISIAPTVINLAKSLSEQEDRVIIYATKTNYPIFNPPNEKIAVVYFLKGYDIPLINSFYNFLNFKIKKFISIIPLIELILFVFQAFLYTLKNYQFVSPHQNISIGVDTNGSILSLINFWIFRKKFAYLSLEITSLSYFGQLSKVVKYLECIAYQKAETVIIQDEERFKSLCSYNNFQHPNVFYLANSTSSLDNNYLNIHDENNYIRKMLNLSKEKFPSLVLQAGMICNDVYSEELAYAFKSIDNGCALIFHSSHKTDIQNPYIQLLQEINSTNLFLSLNPLPYEEIDKVFASATIGLAFYKQINDNYAQIAKASGKLSFYLKHGKPVLVNNLESLSALVQKYQIGVVINDPTDSIEIQSALKTILDNYSFYSQNAITCFTEEFDFANQAKPLLSLMSNW